MATPTSVSQQHPQVHDLLMLYRPISQLFRIFVEPELEARLQDGRLRPRDLPIQVHLLRIVWGAPPARPIVEINQEVDLRAEVKVTRAGVSAGEQLTLADIDPNECYLLPPEVGGQRASFYLGASLYLNMFAMFDLTANAPGGPSAQRMRYPIAEVVRAVQLAEHIRPEDTFVALAAADWPPGRAYYPRILLDYVNGRLRPDSTEFADAVVARYNEEHWTIWCGFWEQIQAFPNRLVYVRDSVQKFFADDYIGAVRVVAPEFEGIVREHLTLCGVTPAQSQRGSLRQFRELVLSRRLMLFPKPMLDLILGFIERDLSR